MGSAHSYAGCLAAGVLSLILITPALAEDPSPGPPEETSQAPMAIQLQEPGGSDFTSSAQRAYPDSGMTQQRVELFTQPALPARLSPVQPSPVLQAEKSVAVQEIHSGLKPDFFASTGQPISIFRSKSTVDESRAAGEVLVTQPQQPAAAVEPPNP